MATVQMRTINLTTYQSRAVSADDVATTLANHHARSRHHPPPCGI